MGKNSINLTKKQKLNLDKQKDLKKVGIGLGWDATTAVANADFDLDVSVFMLGANGKIPKEKYFIFYNNLKSPDGSVRHYGDNREGRDEGDDETIEIDLTKVDASIKKLVFVVTIHEAESRKQNFELVKNSFIRIFDWLTEKEIAKYELEEDFGENTAFEFAQLYREDITWVFQTIGEGYQFNLQGFVDMYYEP